jgi:hypothetical protein
VQAVANYIVCMLVFLWTEAYLVFKTLTKVKMYGCGGRETRLFPSFVIVNLNEVVCV